MPRYKIRDGASLTHEGQVLTEGFVTLERHIAEDPAVFWAVQEVDAAGKAVEAKAEDELARFKTHERVGLLRARLDNARSLVASLEARIEEEEQQLAEEVRAYQARRAKPAPATSAPVPTVKEK